MAKPKPKEGARRRLMKLPARKPGTWSRAEVFRPKGAPPDIVEEFNLKPAASTLRRPPCSRKHGKAGSYGAELRACHVELVFNDGAFLRLCSTKGEPGRLIPIKTHAEATKLSRAFCACRKRGTSATTCATKIAPKAPKG